MSLFFTDSLNLPLSFLFIYFMLLIRATSSNLRLFVMFYKVSISLACFLFSLPLLFTKLLFLERKLSFCLPVDPTSCIYFFVISSLSLLLSLLLFFFSLSVILVMMLANSLMDQLYKDSLS